MNSQDRKFSGFSLLELLVVVVIIIILAGLIVPMIGAASRRAMDQSCQNQGKQIASVVSIYSVSSKGFTPSDADYYVKLVGLKLRTEYGYFWCDPPGSPSCPYDPREAPDLWAKDGTSPSYRYASKLGDLTCPIDATPMKTKHIVPSSYQLLMTGENLMDVEDLSKRLLVRELGSRHEDQGSDANPGGGKTYHVVFADGHAELATRTEYLPGLAVACWQFSDNTRWSKVKDNTIQDLPHFTTVWSKSLTESRFDFLPQVGTWVNTDPATGAQIPDKPDNLMIRMDGFIEFPSPGTWRFVAMAVEKIYLWIDLNENGIPDGSESQERTNIGNLTNMITLNGIQTGKKYPFLLCYREQTGKQYFNLFWSNDNETNLARMKKTILPVAALSFKAAQIKDQDDPGKLY
ncbi:MAG: prepilin-type N-terminal cleavage/methylation domain-containing protein [Planctomycetota bacterium]|nr:prepilin-type N-terminal cleavage/methylation domain-containing protein [Planctomycetota bacterium]